MWKIIQLMLITLPILVWYVEAFRALFNAGCINPISDLENETWVNKEALDSFPPGEPAAQTSIAKGDAK
jgi:hypothetical protein